MNNLGKLILGVVLLWLASSLHAYDLTDSLTINGFGTLGVSTNDSDDYQFRVNPEQETSVERGELHWGINTVVGLQGRYQVNESLSLTAQGVAHYLGNNSWVTDFDWAYVDYQTDWDFSLRAGKFRFPIFHSSELAYVGYSRTYARPPLVFYGVGGYNHLTGAQINYNTPFNEFDLELRATYGKAENETPKGPNNRYNAVESNNIKIVSAKVSNNHFWLNFSYTHLTSDITAFQGANPIKHGQADVSMFGAEWQVRIQNFILDGGYGNGKIDDFMPDEQVFYSSISYPIGNFTPYILFSRKQFKDLPAPIPSTLPGGGPGRPPGGGPGPRPPASLPEQPDESDLNDRIYSLGVRYDFKPGLALKFQWDYIEASVNGVSNNLVREKGSHNAFSVVLDWTF